MPLAKFAPFRAADMNQAWLRNERFWPCPPLPQVAYNYLTARASLDMLPAWLDARLNEMCICTEPLREGDILAPCPVHGWVTH